MNQAPFPSCHPHDQGFVANQLRKFPDRIRTRIATRYTRRYEQGDSKARFEANTALRSVVAMVPQKSFRLAADDAELREHAKHWSRRCQELAAPIKDPERTFKVLSQFAQSRGIQPPDLEKLKIDHRGAVERLKDEHWWRRAIRRDHGRSVEGLARELFFVHKHAGIYSSDEALHRRRGQKIRNRHMLEAILAVNELEQAYTLAELAELSTSNPVIRRGELMTRIAGFEQWADHANHVGEFITLTCPSRMHKATSSKTSGRSIENPKFDGTTPREAQSHLRSVWSKIRASLARQGLTLYGFRVAEPHHDGCPHWHFLVFFPESSRPTVRSTFLLYGLQVDGDEPGATKRRVTFKAIDKSKGSAAGYIAKYIAKNIDGFGIDADLYGTESIEAAERVDAWASCWGIRQFQQLGGPPVTVWRELRRMHNEQDGILEEARLAADDGDWFEFLRVMGGATASRQDQPIRPAYWHEIDKATGELPTNRYGELAASQLFGLQVLGVYHLTRWHRWKLSIGKTPLESPAPIHKRNPERWAQIDPFTQFGPPNHIEIGPSADLIAKASDVDPVRLKFTKYPVCCPLGKTEDGEPDWDSVRH